MTIDTWIPRTSAQVRIRVFRRNKRIKLRPLCEFNKLSLRRKQQGKCYRKPETGLSYTEEYRGKRWKKIMSTPAQSTSRRLSYLDKAIETLKTSGFYWGAVNANQSKALLMKKKVGAFLVRASSDPKHLFTLSLKTELGVTNIRIVMCDGKFSLDQNNGTTARAGVNQQGSPKFDCVVKLVFYYMLLSRRNCRQNSSSSGTRDKVAHLSLTAPQYKEVSSLKHLCRRTLNRNLIGDGVHRLPIPAKLKVYLRSYQYPVWQHHGNYCKLI